MGSNRVLHSVLHSVLDKFEIMGNATTICSTKRDLFQAQNGGHGSGCENHFGLHPHDASSQHGVESS
jgi:hypothetical protein